ncbi:Reticulocyte-binding protein 2-like protein a [Ooceraea biroi]|uniref:Reticulocyte-binding protein 2-like protein a n=1 Tax=Ooceraea biroi TaxID=2015173 RepID=A0A026VSV9_OOCBI|nr:Reticulocyte-binding protein 2-like protein a [Ooceraea biroi]
MQPRVTVALATVWLVVGLVGGTVTLRLPHDQYSPASPRNPGGVQRDQTEDWKDHDSAEDQPLDLWIGSQRSISAEESPGLPRGAKFVERGFPLEDSSEDIVSSKRVYPLSSWQGRLPSITDTEFAADKVDYGEMPETLSRAAAVPPSDSLDDPFVADDTFQDQGPGSVEIYKLDLSKEKALLTATTPSANLSLKIKNKAPKKTGHLDATKIKTTDVKPTMTTTTTTTMDSKIHYRQSNFFDEQRTETPMVNRNAFDVGGVPELQVGCEGLEASPSFHKEKRSINTPDKKKEEEMSASVLLDVTPISLDFDYDLSYDEVDFEEMDELLKLKRLETTTKRNRPNRGDMDASHLNSDHLDEPKRPEKLPVRGDLGDSTAVNSSGASQGESWQPTDSEIKNRERIKVKREPVSLGDDDGANRGRGRRLLWLAAANTEGFADSVNEWKRAKRSIDWGFGENEGVVSSDELQTVNERRRQYEMRYHQDATKRRDQHRETNPENDNIKRQHRGKYPDPGVKRHHGPSASTYIDPRSSLEEVRRRQQEMARRLEQERRQRRYEEDRERLEAARLQTERRRQEMLKERSRSEAGRTKRPEATRPTYYQDSHLLEHRRRQESRPIPNNLMLNQAEARRAASEHERQEADRRREEENRMREHRWKETDQWRRQELARLNSLPVSARIIVRPGGSSSSPPLISRAGFTDEINFTGINPNRQGVPVPKFPAPPTSRPPIKGPGPCVWAVVQCCSSNNNRLVNCFESMGCPGINWDPNPCRGAIAQAARNEVMKFYANAENQ